MRIERNNGLPVQRTFTANIGKTKTWEETLEFLNAHSHTNSPHLDSTQDLNLVKKIETAFRKHPSKETLMIDETHRYGELFNARGVISSSKATLIDTEPARSDSEAPVLNILRRIVDPANRKSFNKLMGEEHAPIYQNWWDKNIKPIWGDINERFRENTFFEGNHDAEFNRDFNAQSGIKTTVTSVMRNGVFVEYRKTPHEEKTAQELYEQVYPREKEDKYQRFGNKVANFLRKIFN